MESDLKILHLEDLPTDAVLINRVLRKEMSVGEILVVDNKKDFENALAEFHPDLVISDHSLPSFTSTEALKIFKQTGLQIPFILVTATVSEDFAVSAMKAGADDYILKDSLTRLPSAIENALERYTTQKERKKAEEAVVTSEKRHRKLIENMTDAIILISESGHLIYQSPSVERITGFTYEDSKGKTVFEFVHPDDLEDCQLFFQLVRAQPGKGMQNQYRIVTRQGHYIWIEGTITNLLQDESVNAYVVNYRDITQRVEADEKIKASELKYRTLIEQASDAIVVALPDAGIIEVNTSAEKLFGYTKEELTKMKLNDLVMQEDSKNNLPLNNEFMKNGVQVYERRIQRKDFTTLDVEISAGNISGGRVLGIFRDITKRKEAEKVIAELNESLEEKVKERTAQLQEVNSDLESFNYSVSHDLRSPLQVITGYTSILSKKYADHLNDDAQQLLSGIKTYTKQMSLIMESLLNLSRLGRASVEKSLCKMHEIVNAVIIELKFVDMDNRVEIRVQNLPDTLCDSGLIKQVWVNLISNAIKFSKQKEKPSIEIGCNELTDELIYFVKDNGAGFDMKYADSLFGVFHRLHNASEFEGTGVGLTIVHRIITKHGCRIWAEGKVNEGATFYFNMPSLKS